MNRFKKAAWAALVVLTFASVWGLAQFGRPVPAPAPAPPAAIAAMGRVESRREAVVAAKGGGRVERQLKREGDWAAEGAAVVLLDQALERAALEEAEAERFRACSAFGRVRALHGQKVASDLELDEADAACRLASARRGKASAALDERTIRAPFSGRVLKTHLDDGELASPGAPLFVLGDTRGLKVRAEVDELDIGRLRVGQKARVFPDALPGEAFEGRVAALSGVLGRKNLRSENPKERADAKVLEVEIELPASDRLTPGLSAEVKIGADLAVAPPEVGTAGLPPRQEAP